MKTQVLKADEGSAVVGFVLVIPLVIAVFIGISQIATVAHTYVILRAALLEGARTSATLDGTLSDGLRTSRAQLTSSNRDPNTFSINASLLNAGRLKYVDFTGSTSVRIAIIGLDWPIVYHVRMLDEKESV